MKFDSVLLNRLEQEVKKEKISSCLIYHKDQTIFHYYKNRKIMKKLCKCNSVTKSIISILIGIAIDRGEIESIHVPISTYFPYLEGNKKNITIEHLLTMAAGYEWEEFGAWGGRPFPMINSKDWVKFVLAREMETIPGTRMLYDSGASHLLSAIVQRATGSTVASYAEKVLFKPLGITEYQWYEDSKGISIGGFGLCLKAEDILKIGIMMMNDGIWSKKRIISHDWVSSSTIARFHTYNHIGAYGYHWWVLTNENGEVYDNNIFFAMGYAGQYIIVSPSDKFVVVFTSDLYNDTFLPLRLFRKLFIANKV
jgi:CubicO group peptidase (beta-lactamase class C family)